MGSECKCNEGYVGVSCECTTSNSSCIGPGQDGRNVSLCSGVGQCICGQCICDDYATNFGGLCEECLVSRDLCEECLVVKNYQDTSNQVTSNQDT